MINKKVLLTLARPLFSVSLLALLASNIFSNSLLAEAPATTNNKPAAATQGNPKSLELNEKGIAAIKANDFALAEKLFHEALAADPKNLTAVFNLAGTLLNNKKSAEALSLLKTYVKEYQKDAGLYARLGDAYFATKSINEAAQAYENTLRIDPGYPGVAAKLGTLYSLMNRPQDAEKMLISAVEQNPNDARSLANLAALFVANGKPDKAVSSARRALQIKATPEVYVTLGMAYLALNEKKPALIAFQRAVDLGDKREELKKQIDELNKSLEQSSATTVK